MFGRFWTNFSTASSIRRRAGRWPAISTTARVAPPTCARARLRATLRPKLAAISAPPDLRGRIRASLAVETAPPAASNPPVLRALPRPEPAPAPAASPAGRSGWRGRRRWSRRSSPSPSSPRAGSDCRAQQRFNGGHENDLAAQHQTFAHDERCSTSGARTPRFRRGSKRNSGFPCAPSAPRRRARRRATRHDRLGAGGPTRLRASRQRRSISICVARSCVDPYGSAATSLETFTGQRDGMSVVGWQPPIAAPPSSPNCRRPRRWRSPKPSGTKSDDNSRQPGITGGGSPSCPAQGARIRAFALRAVRCPAARRAHRRPGGRSETRDADE